MVTADEFRTSIGHWPTDEELGSKSTTITFPDKVAISNEVVKEGELYIYGGDATEYPLRIYSGSTVRVQYDSGKKTLNLSDSFLYLGEFADASHVEVSEPRTTGATETAALKVFGKVSNDVTSSYVIRSGWFRTMITSSQTSANPIFLGHQNSMRIKNCNLTGGAQFHAVQNYFEQSGTSSMNGWLIAGKNTVKMSANATVLANTTVSGLRIDSSIDNAATFSSGALLAAIVIDKNSGAKDWGAGIYISDSEAILSLEDDDVAASHDKCTGSFTLTNSSDWDGYIKVLIGGNIHYILTTTNSVGG